MSGPTSFRLERDDDRGIVTLTLDRPDRLNALTFQVYDELRRAFYALSDEDGPFEGEALPFSGSVSPIT